jgi:hypothetical protein
MEGETMIYADGYTKSATIAYAKKNFTFDGGYG